MPDKNISLKEMKELKTNLENKIKEQNNKMEKIRKIVKNLENDLNIINLKIKIEELENVVSENGLKTEEDI